MRRLAPLAFLVPAALGAPVVAQMVLPKVAPGKFDPTLAKSGKYKVDPFHTQVLFTVNHLGFTEYTGQFTNATGSLTLDTKTPVNSKVEVAFPSLFYVPLQHVIRATGAHGAAAQTYHRQTTRKGVTAVAIYLLGVPLTFVSPWLGIGCALLVALLWFLPNSPVDRLFGD